MADRSLELRALAGELIGDQPDAWDRAGAIPEDLVRKLAEAGALCAEVPARYGGLGLSSAESGEFTAYVGSRCSSLRSVMTSQGMAAWTIQRLGDRGQRTEFLPRLTSGAVAAVGFSETGAGSDLSTMDTEIRSDGDSVVVDGHKVWVTAADYADLLVVFGRYEGGAAAAVVPATTPGVHVERVPEPMGCRAAGHANIRLDGVRLPAANLLGGAGQSTAMLVTTALAYGRISVAWGCVGILRACLAEVRGHAVSREQFGKPLGEHQLVARHVAELLVAEQSATRACEHASRRWDERSPEMVLATVLAKYVSSRQAADGAASAVQVLASAGARDSHPVARAYRDAKLMEIIEGSNEICQLILSEHVLAGAKQEEDR
ncbi:acyl-CoA/acyl-ACP dehydrogenase [Amycolatopsis sp. FU40]|uniref:Acyl CoA dehydrogenase n=1 Tax=Amycolatopsis sp. FU40 TaxID=2914159 RepID=G4XIL5_9PSEU|nr:acyl-CoA dehydrogenase family protein [Amycolatopsis sp. FU40]AEP40922.1 acyl CoA dehydrogenase [Amycolatopsis sp. FU40]UKD51728.1 acyl-CoA/acyl-ACP dehydrogenase [Amycolatopsis sp. FU40]